MKKYDVWIYDGESGCNQPARFEAKDEADARSMARQYIRSWNLQEAAITKIEEVRMA